MTQGSIVNRVRTYSSGTPGRCLNQAGTHHFVIDDMHLSPQEIVPTDAFLAGISSCAVLMVERLAREAGIGVRRAEVDIESVRNAEDPSLFDRISLDFTLQGPDEAQARHLVDEFQRR
jgi:uncharacterized OsmC-like protein